MTSRLQNAIAGIRHTYAVVAGVVLLTVACGGESVSHGTSPKNTDDNNIPLINNDDNYGTQSSVRELVFSETATSRQSVFQCFCDSLYRSTLLIYHFLEQQAVLMIEFDNTDQAFPASTQVHLFSPSVSDKDIARWINNQHSDGLFINPAEPIHSILMSDSGVSITSVAYDSNKTGYAGDMYEMYLVQFSVANHLEPDLFFLNGWSDQTVVYLQTQSANSTY